MIARARRHATTVIVMTTPTAVTAAYIHALMGAMEPDSAAGRKLGDWLRFHQASLRLDFNAALAKPGKAKGTPPANGEALSPKKWQRLRDAVAKLMPAEKDAPEPVSPISRHLPTALRLDAVETGFFRFVFHCDRDGKLRSLCRQLVETRQMDSAASSPLPPDCCAAKWMLACAPDRCAASA